MANTAVLKLQVIADASKAMREMRGVGDSAGDAAGKTQTAGGRIKGAFKAIAGAAAAYLAADKIKQFVSDSITAASDLNETMSKTNQVFGKSAGAIVNWSKDSSNAVGLSQTAALDAADTFAIFGKSAGLTGKDLTGFSKNLVGTAADFASFANTTPDEAIQAIGAALRGETEPIRKYGLMLDDASIKQEAVRIGLIKTTKDAIDPAKKALVVNGLIQAFAKGQKISGDFARTSGGLANQQRILAAKVENAKAAVGQVLLPVVLNAIKIFSSFGKAIANVVKWVDENKGTVILLATAIGIVTLAIYAQMTATTASTLATSIAASATKAWAFAQRILNAAMKANTLALVIAGIILLIAGIVYAYKHFKTFRAIVDTTMRVVGNTFRWLWGVAKVVFRALSAAVRAVAGVFKSVWDRISGIVKTATKIVSTAVRVMISVVKGYLKVLYTVYVLPWILAFKALKTVVTQWAPAVYGWMKNIVAKVVSGLSTVANVIKAPFVSAWNWIKSNIVNPMQRMFSGLAGAIRSALSGVTNAITAPFKAAWEFIKKYVLRPVSSAWNSVANLINSVSIDIPKIHIPLDGDIGGGSIGFPNVPTMPSWATGAYVTAPTAALIGEAGGEWVLPDAKLRALLRQELGAGGPTIVVQGALDPDAVARQIERILRKRAQRVGGVAARGQVGAFQ